VYAETGESGAVEFHVHNNGRREQTVRLDLEYPEGEHWKPILSASEVRLMPGESKPVELQYDVSSDGDEWTCHLRATPSDDSGFTTYSTLRVRKGVAPAKSPITMPLVLQAYRHENEQFGYLPNYPVTNQVYFDIDNRPAIAFDKGLWLWREERWVETEAVRPFGTKIAFDARNNTYLIGDKGSGPAMLHAPSGSGTFTATSIPIRGAFDIETFSGHNRSDEPPAFICNTFTERDPEIMWHTVNDLNLFVPEMREDGTISLGDPILVSRKSLGAGGHSGIPSTVVSRGDKVHVTWGEATDPEKDVPGVPTYVATYDRKTQALGTPALVGYGPPANDAHNTPGITMDSQGYLHVLVGTHGWTFVYARSLEPNDAGGGWTEPEPLGANLQQTYIGLVCDQNDTLHLVFRLWQYDRTYFPAGNYACLAYMRKESGKSWSEPKPLIVAPFSDYSIFYHRLTIATVKVRSTCPTTIGLHTGPTEPIIGVNAAPCLRRPTRATPGNWPTTSTSRLRFEAWRLRILRKLESFAVL